MPKTGHFILHSNVLPEVTAGRYVLKTEQTDTPFPIAAEETHLQVSAPRFTMPTDQILSSFPPANAVGAFGDRLPQLVLKRRTLPWERNPHLKPGDAPVVSTTPFLALVVVAEGEAELSTATPVADCVTPGTKLFVPTDRDVEQGLYLGVTETVVKKIFPCQEDLSFLTHVREVDVNDTELANGDDDGFLAVVIANRLPVFDKAKSLPVRYMACLVNLEGQLAALPPPQPAAPSFQYELAQDWRALSQIDPRGGPDLQVMGTGKPVPQPGTDPSSGLRGIAPQTGPSGTPLSFTAADAVGASLDGTQRMSQAASAQNWSQATAQVASVALESDAKRRVRDTMGAGFRLPIGVYALEKVLRFPVLAHWSFTTNEGATFETLMQDLDVGLLGTVPPLPPNSPAAQAQPEVVQTGHIGLDHRSRRGDATRAWYRGPCVPFPTPRDGNNQNQPLPLAHSADQLRRVIPDGREDLSLAAGFEIGRLLALSQLSVVSALLRFRAEQFGAGRVRELLKSLLHFPLPSLSNQRVDLGRYTSLKMVEQLARDSGLMIGPQRPVVDPGRPLAVNGALDELIAGGLGLDLSSLKERAGSVGLVAALEQTAVPTGAKGVTGSTLNQSVPALRAALDRELLHTLLVAAPVKAQQKSAKRGSSARATPAEPDPLDLLIANVPLDEDDDPTGDGA